LCNCAYTVDVYLLKPSFWLVQICCLCKGFNHFGDIVQQNSITLNNSIRSGGFYADSIYAVIIVYDRSTCCRVSIWVVYKNDYTLSGGKEES
jgi:hypothetical protein